MPPGSSLSPAATMLTVPPMAVMPPTELVMPRCTWMSSTLAARSGMFTHHTWWSSGSFMGMPPNSTPIRRWSKPRIFR